MSKLFKRNKGGDDGGDDPNRSPLFGSKKGRGPSSETNPYAAQPAGSDPYMNNNANPPPPYGGSNSGMDRFRQEKSPVPPGGYGGASAGDRYGASSSSSYGGYGSSDRYGGAGNQPAAPASRYGAGGYGGFGGASGAQSNQDRYGGAPSGRYGGRNEEPDDGSKQALFGNAPQRIQQQQSQGLPPPNTSGDWQSGVGPNYGQSQGYGQAEERELTAEEQEEEDVNAAKQEIRFIKQQDVASTRNALRIAQQAEETGRQTLARLGEQGERIHNTERNLDLASNQNRLAAEKARELKTLNRSMFAVHVSNPFTSAKRAQERENAVLDQARKDRDMREASRTAAWSSSARQAEFARDMNKASSMPPKKGGSLAERAKYQFEADSEDEAMEEEIDQNLDLLHGAAKRLGGLAGAMGREVDEQNKHIDRIGGKVDNVDDEIALNRSRLDRIR